MIAPQIPPTAVLPHALHIPGINKLAGKRVILASGSPRRKDILQVFVRLMSLGIAVLLISSLAARAGSFSRSRTLVLCRGSQSRGFRKYSRIPCRYRDAQSCRSIRATRRTVSIHLSHSFPFKHRLLAFQRADPENGPDLVIGADTVVLTHAQPVSSDIAYSELPAVKQELLEKPVNKADNLRMLQDLNGSVCEVVTGVSLGERHLNPMRA